jgi:hypothetical protein
MPTLRAIVRRSCACFLLLVALAAAGCGPTMGPTATPGNSRVPCAENCGSDATCMAQCDPSQGHRDPVQAAQPWR